MTCKPDNNAKITVTLSYGQLTLSSLFALFLLLALANAPTYQQDGSP